MDISDNELQKFADGQLDAQRYKEIEKYLLSSPDLQARYEALTRSYFVAKVRDELESTTIQIQEQEIPNHARSRRQRLGPYQLIKVIGRGGMGEVWLAAQSEPIHRKVAIKLIKAGLPSQDLLARFDAERQALAMMNHECIAKVFDAGTSQEGIPYFVMELVKGIPLTTYCDGAKLSVRERLELFTRICEGVQHAHQRGIIHRDLKPSNILVSTENGKHIPKIIDFGLAKALQQSDRQRELYDQTKLGQVIGTLGYMSPEQANLTKADIDTRADIYALGTILYELLTGSTPLNTECLHQQAVLMVLERIRSEDPPKPSDRLSKIGEAASQIGDQRQIQPRKLGEILKGELDWIVMKAIEKERSRRYDSPASFAADIRRFLDGDAILARPPSFSYQARKWANRNRILVGTTFATLTVVLFGIIALLFSLYQIDQSRQLAIQAKIDSDQRRTEMLRERDRANEEAARATESERKTIEQKEAMAKKNAQNSLVLASISRKKGNLQNAKQKLHQIPYRYRDFEWYRECELQSSFNCAFYGHKESVTNVAISPDGEFVASAELNGDVIIWDAHSGKQHALLQCKKSASALRIYQSLAFDRESGELIHLLGSVSFDIPVVQDAPVYIYRYSAKSFEKLSEEEVNMFLYFSKAKLGVATSLDGKLIAFLHGDSLRLLANNSDQTIPLRYPGIATAESLKGVMGSAYAWDNAIALSGDGSLLYITTPFTIIVFDVKANKISQTLPGSYTTVAISPSGRYMAATKSLNADTGPTLPDSFCLDMIDLQSSEVIAKTVRSTPISTMQFGPDESFLVLGTSQGAIEVLDTFQLGLMQELAAHDGPVSSLAFGSDGRTLASGGDTTAKMWRLGEPNDYLQVATTPTMRPSIAFSPDGREVAMNVGFGISILQLATAEFASGPEEDAGKKSEYTSVAYSEDGTRIAAGDCNWNIVCWDRQNFHDPIRLPGSNGSVLSIAFAGGDNNRIIAVTSCEPWTQARYDSVAGSICVWDIESRKLIQTLCRREGAKFERFSLTQGSNNLLVLLRSGGNLVDNVDVVCLGTTPSDSQALPERINFPLRGYDLPSAVHPWKTELSVSGRNGDIHVYDFVKRQKVREIPGNWGPVSALAYNATGTRLAATCNGVVLLWNANTNELEAEYEFPGEDLKSVCFSPDSEQLAVRSERFLYVVNSRRRTRRYILCSHDTEVSHVSFSKDETKVLSFDRSGTLSETDLGTAESILKGSNLNSLPSIPMEIWGDWMSLDKMRGAAHSPNKSWFVNRVAWGIELINLEVETQQFREQFRKQATTAFAYHQNEAKAAFKRKAWYSAAFHLQWLKQLQPGNRVSELNLKYAIAKLRQESTSGKSAYRLTLPLPPKESSAIGVVSEEFHMREAAEQLFDLAFPITVGETSCLLAENRTLEWKLVGQMHLLLEESPDDPVLSAIKQYLLGNYDDVSHCKVDLTSNFNPNCYLACLRILAYLKLNEVDTALKFFKELEEADEISQRMGREFTTVRQILDDAFESYISSEKRDAKK